MDRFGLMMKNDEFHDWRPLAHAKLMFQKHFRCADAHCGLGNDSQSSSALLVKLKLNATREKAGQERTKLFMATGVFFCHVLRIQPFVCNEIAREHRRHTKEDFLRSSGNPM